MTREALAQRIASERTQRGKVVFTNGVFDLLHIGHVRYLEFARGLGSILVVAVNSDASVRALNKGAARPLVPADERAEVVAALGCVDYVCVFDEVLPDVTIRALRPDIHVKSRQYRIEDLPEAQAVAEVGGEIILAPHIPGTSTTAIVRRMREEESSR